MKILRVHCKNINSLEGENRVDFTQAPFIHSNVFAITGANGSGKSSILDAITLGLYGQTPRAQHLIGQVGEHVMTQRTNDCFAEVEFALHLEKYRSTWSVQRNGDILDNAQMQLMRLSDNSVLASNATQTNQVITELTGMNFRNFTRAMLLAQGDFAAFLHALDNERLDILEKIIGTDSYEQYKNEVIHNAEQAQKVLTNLQQTLNRIELIAPEKLESYQLDLMDFNAQVNDFQKEQTQLRSRHDALKSVLTLQTQVKQQQQKLGVAENLAQATQTQLNTLLNEEDALTFNDDLDLINNKSIELQQSKIALNALQTELQNLQIKLINAVNIADVNLAELSISEQQQKISQARIELSTVTANRQAENSFWQSLAIQLSEKKSALNLTQTWLEEHANDAMLLNVFPDTNKIKSIRLELTRLKNEQLNFEQWTKGNTLNLKKQYESLETVIKKTAVLTEQKLTDELALKQLLQGNSIEELNNLQVMQYQRVKDFQELVYLAQTHEKLMGNGFRFFAKKSVESHVTHDVKTLTEQLEQLHLDIKREENIKRVLESAIVRETLTKKLMIHRAQLIEDEPCHLCGSLQHPYITHPPIQTNSQQALVDQQAKIRHLVTSANTLRVRIKETEKQSVSKQSKYGQAQQLSSQWIILANRLNASSSALKISNIALMKQLLSNENEELKNINALLSNCERKQNSIDKASAAIAKNETFIAQLQQNIQQLESTLQHRTLESNDNHELILKLQQEESVHLQQLTEQLSKLNETLPDIGQEDNLLERLNTRRRDYQNYHQRLINLQEELMTLQTKQAACQQEMSAYDGQFSNLNAKVQREESIGLHLAIIEKQQVLIAKETLITERQESLNELEKNVQEKLANSRFNSLNDLQETLKRLEQLPQLKQRYETQQADVIAKSNVLMNLQEKLMKAQGNSDIEGLQFDSINEQLLSVNRQLDIAKAESKRLTQLIEKATQIQKQYNTLTQQLNEQELITKPHLEALAQLQAEDGITLRRRLQQRLIDSLLLKTNTVLEKISGRYYLRQSFSENGLALMIEDTYQAKTQRALKTLSGGESFIISLALALALSELASNGKSVDSLFLDEGFGHLDAESLYTVISTLENLHSQGKMVGVISHVEAVQKRFKTQLQVLKKPNGFSVLKVM